MTDCPLTTLGLGGLVEHISAENLDQDELVGKHLNGFEVKRLLGHGGMGAVYEAEQISVGRRVALKVLRINHDENATAEKRFAREARAIAQLNHPNIVTLYDFGHTPEGISYIAMELVDGKTLTSYLTERVEMPFIMHVLTHVLGALRAAHKIGIIHRDLKPDNIMLSTLGNDSSFSKVLDFGLARLAKEEDLRLTQAGELFGTPLYMSPEQASGEDDVTLSSDIYSLACIVYEMIEGHPPFTGKKAMHVMLKHVHKDPPPFQRRRALGFSDVFEDIIMCCLSKNSEDRPESAEMMLMMLSTSPEGMFMPGGGGNFSTISVDDSIGFSFEQDLGEFAEEDDLFSEMEIEDNPGIEVFDSLILPPPSGENPAWKASVESASSPPAPAEIPKKLNPLWVIGLSLLLLGGGFAFWSFDGLSLLNSSSKEATPQEISQQKTSGQSGLGIGAETTSTKEGQSDTEFSIQTTQDLLHREIQHALDEVQERAITERFRAALSSPDKFKPKKVIMYKKMIMGWTWSQSVSRKHKNMARSSNYADPFQLFFGNN